MGKLRKMRTLADDDEDEIKPVGTSKTQSTEQPAWMKQLLDRCKEWLSVLPTVSRLSCSCNIA